MLAVIMPVCIPTLVPPAAAWDGYDTAAYADQYWAACDDFPYSHAPNPPYICLGRVGSGWFDQDCANFASEALHAGGYSMVNATSGYKGTYTGNDQWWWRNGYGGIYNWSLSWTVASKLFKFLTVYDHDGGNPSAPGGGFVVEMVHPSAGDLYNSLNVGDLIFFDQDSSGGWSGTGIDHVKIEVGWSTYDYADQHGPGQYHHMWNSWDHFPNPNNVLIWEVSIDPRNI
jgi:hypothetical protein